MSGFARNMMPAGLADRPTYQWEASRGGAPLTLQLFGALGLRELQRVVDAVSQCGRSPRETVCVDFEGVEHLDYRALSEFTAALSHSRNRGAFVWFVGLSPYLRSLFQVAGQGSALSRLDWRPEAPADRLLERRDADALRGAAGSTGEEAWSMTGI